MTEQVNAPAEKRSFRVAVVGATGLVGETMIKVLEERGRCDLRTLARALPRYGRDHIFWVTDPECSLRRRTGTGRT